MPLDTNAPLFVGGPVATGTVNATTVAAGEPQRISGTGTTSAATTVALPTGRMATLIAGPNAIRFRLGSSAPTAAATDVYLPAGGRFDWFVVTATTWVSVEAGDGSSAFEAWVWVSSL